MKKLNTNPKLTSEMFKDCSKVGAVYYNLEYPHVVDEMHESLSTWKYKEALSAVIAKLRKLDKDGFEYQEHYCIEKSEGYERHATKPAKSNINTDAFEHIIQEVVKTINEELDGLDW